VDHAKNVLVHAIKNLKVNNEHQVYIGLGSNLDKPIEQVTTAIDALAKLKAFKLIKTSSLYRSLPMGPQDQPDYINAVVLISTGLEPQVLLSELQQLEKKHGRVRKGEQWGPRTLDLDILLYDDLILNKPDLVIPHPGLHQRAFVLYPLSDITPELDIPGRGKLSELLQNIPATGLERISA